MYIRGASPLSWDSGVAMTWTDGNVWVWETTQLSSGEGMEYKPLINDSTWASGNNYYVTGGQAVDIYPGF